MDSGPRPARVPASCWALVLAVLGLFACPQPSGAIVVAGDVLFCDASGALGLAHYSASTGAVTSITSGGLIGQPLGVAIESETTALVTTLSTGRVVRVNLVTGAQSLVTAGGLIAANPDGIAMGLNGHIYVTELNGGKIIEVNPTTGAQRLVTGGSPFVAPIFIVAMSTTKLAVSDPSRGIVEIDIASGTQRVITTGGLLNTPQGLSLLPGGDLLVADYNRSKLIRVNPATGSQADVASALDKAWGVAHDGQGTAYVSRYVSGPAGLIRVNLATGVGTYLSTPVVTAFGIQVYMPAGDPPPPPPPAPPAPTGFNASEDSPTGITLRWDAVPDVLGYTITRNGSYLATAPAGSIEFVDQPAIGTYTYCIASYGAGGLSPFVCDNGTRRDYVNTPRIQFVRDVPGDQGGHAAIGWLASEIDFPGGTTITGYRVWRRLPLGLEGAPSASPAADAAAAGPELRVLDGVPGYWEPILTLPAGYREAYGAVIATTQDSLPGDNPHTAIIVSALTSNPFVFYDSAVDSGYSVDNLAPPPPPFLRGAYVSASSVKLSWRSADAPDVREYEVYRGTSASADLSGDTHLASTPDTSFVDPAGGFYFYKVRARDIHGNPGLPSVLSPLEIPTSAWVIHATADMAGGRPKIIVQVTQDFGGSEATVLRAAFPNPEDASTVRERLLPVTPGRFEYVEESTEEIGTRWYWMHVRGSGGRVAVAGPIVVELDAIPLLTHVETPSPNPTSGAQEIAFVVGTDAADRGAAAVRIRVIDIAGREVRNLGPLELPVGRHVVPWDGRSQKGARLAAGVYRMLVTIGARTTTKSIVLLP